MTKTKKRNVHIIPHTHWDKEWYFTSSRSRMYLVDHVKEVMEILADNPDFNHYLLDAQSSLITDYLALYSEDEAMVRELIASKRLIVGPWYTQTDQLVISQESIVRNLFYGMKDASNLGHAMHVAYAPDAFGQGGNMPQVYKQFGISDFLFWRGIADNWLKTTEFIWEGIDGTRMLAEQMYYSYYYGANIPDNPNVVTNYIDQTIVPLEKRATTSHIYFPNGGDQVPITRNLTSIVEQLNREDDERVYLISSPEAYFKAIRNDVDESSLPIIKGDMIEGKGSRVHKSIYSTRVDMKQSNNEIENYLVNALEPILTMSADLGHIYPHKEVEQIWKQMFENAAHDSIGGCNSDSTNQDISARYKVARDTAENLLDLHMRKISQNIKQDEHYAFTIFNTLPYERKTIIEADIYIPEGDFIFKDIEGNELSYSILTQEDQSDYLLNQFAYLTPHLYRDEMDSKYIPEKVLKACVSIETPMLPALGYTQIYLEENTTPNYRKVVIESRDTFIENSVFKVSFDGTSNTFTVENKVTNQTYENQFNLEDNGDDGDSYNYSPPRQDDVITSKDAQVVSIKATAFNQTSALELVLGFNLPADLEMRAHQKRDTYTEITLQVSISEGENYVRGKVILDNNILSHRLCMTMATDIASSFAIVDGIYCSHQSPVSHPCEETWESEGWTEKPISINPMQSFVTLSQNDATVGVMTEGIREYEIIGEKFDTIRLTLFRTFGYMGKEDLLYRPGRASGEKIVATPDAQLLGEIVCTFATVYQGQPFDQANIARLSKEYLSPVQIYELTDFLNGRTIFPKNNPETKEYPVSYTLLKEPIHDAVVGTVKKSEYSDDVLIRCFNPYLQSTISLGEASKQFKAKAVLLDEKTVVETDFELKPAQMQTFILTK